MPCGPPARLAAYVAYENLAFTELQALLAALTDRGITRVERAPAGGEASNPIPVLDQDRAISGRAAARHADVSTCLSASATLLSNCAVAHFVPLMQPGSRKRAFIEEVRAAYGRAKASQLAQ